MNALHHHLGVSKNRDIPKWMVYNENPIKMDDLRGPLFLETSIWENLLLGHVFHPHRRCSIFKQLFTEKFLVEVYVAFDRGLPIHVWVRASKKENGPIVMFLLAKEEGNPRKRQQKLRVCTVAL